MSSTSNDTSDASVARVDMKLEVVVIPVSDVDRAEEFYARLGWRQDVTPPGSGVVQFTPRGSACSVQFGKSLTSAAPGSAQRTYLIVSDIDAARKELVAAGIEVGEIFHLGADGPVSGPDPNRGTYRSFALFSDPDGNSWLLQQITTRLPGREWED
jgi:catechol 2,3-dioxygenase-like lactoylglutathione lyase family enzyme